MTTTPTYTISIETGGTFTDLVLSDEQQVLGLYKHSTTYPDLFPGISGAIDVAAEDQGIAAEDLLARTSVFVYSTTHSTNAILKGTTARTALITTEGHRDVLLYKEGGKDQAHDWAIPFPEPYVPRRLTFELRERILADGSVAVPLDEDEVRATLRRLGELEVEAIGVCLLWSPVAPQHELRVGELIEELLPGVPYSLSHRTNRIIREYRRAASTVIDASIKPLMHTHLRGLESRLHERGFRGKPLMVTHVSGGVLSFDAMLERPIETVDSGPALAPIAGHVVDQAETEIESEDVIVVDTGGTSFDASLVLDGRVAYTREKWLGRRWYGDMTGLPAVDTRSIGAGGGSIASVDAGGLLQVGPDSAGSDPGPVAYGRGGSEPTVTDCALVLGYIDPANFLGGRMTLDRDAAAEAIRTRLAEPLGMSVDAAAEAVIVIASEQMRGLLSDMTVAQGRDARDCTMVAGGGAAGLNIVRIAREAEIRHVLIPRLAAGLSALGGQYSDIMATFARGQHTLSSAFDFGSVNGAMGDLAEEVETFLAGVDHAGERHRRFSCEARYDQQLWEIDVDLGDRSRFDDADDVATIKRAFDRNHERLFAVQQPDEPIEIITWRGEARVERSKPALVADGGAVAVASAPVASGTRDVVFDGESVSTPVYQGSGLAVGARVVGPAILEEETTSIVLLPGSTATMKPSHYLVEVGVDG